MEKREWIASLRYSKELLPKLVHSPEKDMGVDNLEHHSSALVPILLIRIT